MFSWMVATNHCALGLMTPGVKAAGSSAHCPCEKSTPVKKDGIPSPGHECCKTLNGVWLPTSKVQAKHIAPVVPFLNGFCLVLPVDYLGPVLSIAPSNNGPPLSHSFAESVLQHSLFSHAPPVLS